MKIIINIYKFFLSRRYNIEIKGKKHLKHNGPILLLPNHVALIDPQILIVFLYKYIKLSPVASEKFFNVPVLKQVMKAFGTIPIGEIEQGANSKKVKEVFSKVVDSMKEGKNVLIYPSGGIYRQGFESIKGKQSVYNICKNLPENTKIIGLRDTGLWGSMWSMAWDNGESGFFKLFFKGIFIIFLNFIFFVPKRKVLLEIEDITKQINVYKKMSLGEFNGFLENFYNKNGEEKINYIKHYFYFNDVKNRKKPEIIKGSLEELAKIQEYDLSKIDNKIKSKIINKVAEIKDIPVSKINEKSNLILDLFFDSLDLAEIKSFIQVHFSGASNPPIGDLKTIGDLVIMAIGQSKNIEEMKKCEWQEFKSKGLLVDKIV